MLRNKVYLGFFLYIGFFFEVFVFLNLSFKLLVLSLFFSNVVLIIFFIFWFLFLSVWSFLDFRSDARKNFCFRVMRVFFFFRFRKFFWCFRKRFSWLGETGVFCLLEIIFVCVLLLGSFLIDLLGVEG